MLWMKYAEENSSLKESFEEKVVLELCFKEWVGDRRTFWIGLEAWEPGAIGKQAGDVVAWAREFLLGEGSHKR